MNSQALLLHTIECLQHCPGDAVAVAALRDESCIPPSEFDAALWALAVAGKVALHRYDFGGHNPSHFHRDGKAYNVVSLRRMA